MIGRTRERQELEAALTADEAQLIAVCGRRRVGRRTLSGRVFPQFIIVSENPRSNSSPAWRIFAAKLLVRKAEQGFNR